MMKRLFFFASLLCVIAAIVLHANALRQESIGASLRGDGVKSPDAEKGALFARADHESNQAKASRAEGYYAAAAGIVCLIASYLRKEPAKRLIVVALLVAYGLLQFVAS